MLALRTCKIPRDNITTVCNRLFSKTDLNISSNKATELSENAQDNFQLDNFRYVLSNTTKPTSVLPTIDCAPKEPARILLGEMRHLQPARQSKFICGSMNPKMETIYEPGKANLHKELVVECPFPRPLIEPQTNAITFTERSKHKPSHFRGSLKSSMRNYSTSPFLMVARGYGTKRDDAKCEKPKKPCKKSDCPHFVPKDCDASKGSHCEHYYIDPKCTKKMAPYPSYSESCHELLEDDPSECFQCPWQKCRGVESIKPPKKRYHTWSRQYHTWRKPFNMAMIPSSVSNNPPFYVPMECDLKRKPCKKPPGKCGKNEKKEKCPPLSKERKKKCTLGVDRNDAYKCCDGTEVVTSTPSWVVLGTMQNASLYEVNQQPLTAHETDCKCDKCKNHSIDLMQKSVYDMKKKCPKDEKCPPADKPQGPLVDHTIDERFQEKDPCCQRAKRDATKRRKPRERPRIYVPEPRDY